MIKYLVLILFIFCTQLSTFAQTQDTLMSTIGRRGKATDNIQKADNKLVVIKNDSTKVDTSSKKKGLRKFLAKENYSPRKAMLLSAILPPAGQIYNKTGWYWRIPLCAAAYTGSIYWLTYNQFYYKQYNNIYKAYLNDKNYVDPRYSKDVALNQRGIYDKKVSYAWMMIFGAHLYCVSDAFVTAHLNQFDVDDNLNLQIAPASESMGIALKINF